MLNHNLASDEGTYQNHAVAALLNACFSPDAYGATPEEVIFIVRMVYGLEENPLGKTWKDAFALFVGMNGDDTLCFFDAHGQCEENFVQNSTGQCIPACPEGYYFDPEALACVEGEPPENLESAATDPINTEEGSTPYGQTKTKTNNGQRNK